MNTQEVRNNDAAKNASAAAIDMKLEVVIIPVSDVDRAKEFYAKLGWRQIQVVGSTFRWI